MRKDEYLNQMKQALEEYDKEYVDEILSDYEEHFQGGLEQGKSEEAICEELGAVEDIVKEMKELMGEEYLKTAQIAEKEIIETPIICEEKQNDLLKEGKDGIKKIHFTTKNMDIHVSPSADGKFHIYTKNKADMEYLEERYEGDTYYGRLIKEKASRFFGTQFFLRGFSGDINNVIMEVPADLDEVVLENLNGGGYTKNINCAEMRLTSRCGDFYINTVTGKNISVFTKCGDVRAEHVKADKILTKGLCGDVSFHTVYADKLNCTAKSGDIKIEHSEINHVQTEGSSGDIFLNTLTGETLTCKASSGDMKAQSVDIKTTNLKASSGDITAEFKTHGTPAYAYAKAGSGDVKVKGIYQAPASDLEHLQRENNITITAKTVSGDIRISREDS